MSQSTADLEVENGIELVHTTRVLHLVATPYLTLERAWKAVEKRVQTKQ